MTTIRALVDATIDDYLMTGQRVSRGRSATAIDDATTTLTLSESTEQVGPNTLLQHDFELMSVWSVTGSALTIERGDYSSTAASIPAGSILQINPIFRRHNVLEAIKMEIASLNADPGIWQPRVVDLTTSGSLADIYDLGAGEVHGVAAVDQLVDDVWEPVSRWEVKRGLTGKTGITGDAGLQIIGAYSNRPIRAVVKAPLGVVNSTTASVETTTGLANVRLLAVGAAIQMNAGREIKRSFIEHQGSSRRANEVQPFQTLSSGRELQALYKRLKGEAITALNQKYPSRRKVR